MKILVIASSKNPNYEELWSFVPFGTTKNVFTETWSSSRSKGGTDDTGPFSGATTYIRSIEAGINSAGTTESYRISPTPSGGQPKPTYQKAENNLPTAISTIESTSVPYGSNYWGGVGQFNNTTHTHVTSSSVSVRSNYYSYKYYQTTKTVEKNIPSIITTTFTSSDNSTRTITSFETTTGTTGGLTEEVWSYSSFYTVLSNTVFFAQYTTGGVLTGFASTTASFGEYWTYGDNIPGSRSRTEQVPMHGEHYAHRVYNENSYSLWRSATNNVYISIEKNETLWYFKDGESDFDKALSRSGEGIFSFTQSGKLPVHEIWYSWGWWDNWNCWYGYYYNGCQSFFQSTAEITRYVETGTFEIAKATTVTREMPPTLTTSTATYWVHDCGSFYTSGHTLSRTASYYGAFSTEYCCPQVTDDDPANNRGRTIHETWNGMTGKTVSETITLYPFQFITEHPHFQRNTDMNSLKIVFGAKATSGIAELTGSVAKFSGWSFQGDKEITFSEKFKRTQMSKKTRNSFLEYVTNSSTVHPLGLVNFFVAKPIPYLKSSTSLAGNKTDTFYQFFIESSTDGSSNSSFGGVGESGEIQICQSPRTVNPFIHTNFNKHSDADRSRYYRFGASHSILLSPGYAAKSFTLGLLNLGYDTRYNLNNLIGFNKDGSSTTLDVLKYANTTNSISLSSGGDFSRLAVGLNLKNMWSVYNDLGCVFNTAVIGGYGRLEKAGWAFRVFTRMNDLASRDTGVNVTWPVTWYCECGQVPVY